MKNLLLIDLPERLEGDHFYLSPFQKGDGEQFYNILQENKDHLKDVAPEVETIKDVEQAEIRNCGLYANWVSRIRFVWAIREKSTDNIIGENWIEPIDKNLGIYELGYFIVKSKEGKGFVTQSCKLSIDFIFTHLGATKVEIHTDSSNEKSYLVAERLGFKKEAHMRNRDKTAGKFVDRVYYGLLKSEH